MISTVETRMIPLPACGLFRNGQAESESAVRAGCARSRRSPAMAENSASMSLASISMSSSRKSAASYRIRRSGRSLRIRRIAVVLVPAWKTTVSARGLASDS